MRPKFQLSFLRLLPVKFLDKEEVAKLDVITVFFSSLVIIEGNVESSHFCLIIVWMY